MILDFDRAQNSELPACDVLVVGAGAVGLTLAVSLVRRNRRVLVVESGGAQFDAAAQDLNEGLVAGRPHRGITEGRARVLGGTTTLWGGQLAPFSAMDFENRSWVPDSGWPIPFSELQPYYDAAARLLGLSPDFERDEQVWHALGATPPQSPAGLQIFLTRWLKETNFARMFKAQIESPGRLTVLLRATAARLCYDPDDARISGIEVRSPRGRKAFIEAPAIVLAPGTIEASRLMLVSAALDSRVPWAKNSWLGEAFQDHLDLRAARIQVLDKPRFGALFDNIYLKGFKFQPKIRLDEAVQREEWRLNIAASFLFESSLSQHLANAKLFARALLRGSVPENWRAMPAHVLAMSRIFLPLAKRYLKDRRAFNLSDKGIFLNLHCEQAPLRASSISLADKTDGLAMPRVRLDWRVDGREIETMAAFCERISRWFAEARIAKVEIEPRLLARDAGILEACSDTNHHCGGLRMGRTVQEGVVDKDLRVFGTNNLYVAGASTFPTSGYANPTFTAIALALRLAGHLEQRVA